jgi:hypothetical protein
MSANKQDFQPSEKIKKIYEPPKAEFFKKEDGSDSWFSRSEFQRKTLLPSSFDETDTLLKSKT